MTHVGRVWRNLIHKQERDEDLDRELESYVDLLTAEKASAGLSEAEARRQARIELGGREQTKEAVREIRAGAFLEQLWADIRYAVRALRRNPGFAAATVLSLALGVGVNTSAFSSVKWLVLHPFPYPAVDRIVTLWETTAKATSHEPVAPANFFDWQQANRSFEKLAAFRGQDITMTGHGEPDRIQAQQVTSEFFQVFGTNPQAGRTFLSDEAEPGHDNKVVLSYHFWKSKLASSPASLGQTLTLGQRSYSIVGIMPEDFEYPPDTDLWTPLALTPAAKADRATASLGVIGLRKTGMSNAEAASQFRDIAHQLALRFPLTNEDRSVRLMPLLDTANGNGIGSRFIVVLFAATFFVMLLACANAANLLLARAASRQKEIGIRSALGANNSRIIRQFLVEIALLAILAAVVGILFGDWDLQHTKSGVPTHALRYVPGIKRLHMDVTTAVYSVALSVVCGFLCGIPALFGLLGRGNSARLLESLKESGRTSTPNSPRARLRKLIVLSESALALLLLVGAGLMVETFHHMLTFYRGFEPAHLLTLQTALPESRYRLPDQIRAFYSRVLDGFPGEPGIQSAAASAYVAFGAIQTEGRRTASPGQPEAGLYAVSPNYFSVMSIPVREGRSILPADSPGSTPVVVVSEAIAQHYWPGSSALGHRIRFGNVPQWFTVVGVCGDIRDWFSGERQAAAYASLVQSPRLSATFFVRTQGDPLQSSSSARHQVYQADPDQPVFELDSIEHRLSVETSGLQAAAHMMTTYAVIALLLAVTGIYSLSSYLMTQRTHEIGLRMALGADRSDILHLSLRESARFAGTGLAIGLIAALGLARLMSNVLYGVIALNWIIFVEIAILLAVCAFIAAYLPARRASRVDPVIALRHD